ncbi:putative quinol monooxygenase [Streptomyces sp. NPDC060205]|uniref:putative quinol monooxygenase n=1 Tax=Streptomyces sp. NPDC060205 TaxID=3347072 RepID=UPI003663A003
MTNSKSGYITVLWEARAKAGKEAEMRAFVAAAVSPSRNDFGNIDYDAHEVEGEPGTIIIYERWVSRQALDEHLNAPRMKELGPQLLEVMEGTMEEAKFRILEPIRPER